MRIELIDLAPCLSQRSQSVRRPLDSTELSSSRPLAELSHKMSPSGSDQRPSQARIPFPTVASQIPLRRPQAGHEHSSPQLLLFPSNRVPVSVANGAPQNLGRGRRTRAKRSRASRDLGKEQAVEALDRMIATGNGPGECKKEEKRGREIRREREND